MTIRQLMHLAAAMAHEVRNPLNSMAIHADLMEGRLTRQATFTDADRDTLKRSAQVVAGEIERIDRILEEYLDYAGPAEAARRPVEPRTFLAAALARTQAIAAARDVKLAIASAPDNTWSIDAEVMGEALDAVLVNAVEASAPGSTVEVSGATRDDEAEIVVRDRGEGIPAGDLPQLFRLGFSHRGRAGVGLPVAKQIVKGHGGSIKIESDGAGTGAVVTIRVPLERDA